jgi:DNA-binding NarL/FixJ family response regulator
LAGNARDEPLAGLTPRETEVLALMAEGRSNAAIAERLVITERAVAKHTANIFLKLDLPPSNDDNRRARAVLPTSTIPYSSLAVILGYDYAAVSRCME